MRFKSSLRESVAALEEAADFVAAEAEDWTVEELLWTVEVSAIGNILAQTRWSARAKPNEANSVLNILPLGKGVFSVFPMAQYISATSIGDLSVLATPQTTIFCDIDDTVITPTDAWARWSSPYKEMLGELKKNKAQYPNFADILSTWRLARAVQLVEPSWPEQLASWRSRSAGVYALTQVDAGRFGRIPSMEEWRYQEVSGLGCHFTDEYPILGRERFNLINSPTTVVSGSFYKGIFMTNGPKNHLFKAICEASRPQSVLFWDDRSDHLSAVGQVCDELGIDYIGVHYLGASLISGIPNPEVVALQKQRLFSVSPVWLDDTAAAQELEALKQGPDVAL